MPSLKRARAKMSLDPFADGIQVDPQVAERIGVEPVLWRREVEYCALDGIPTESALSERLGGDAAGVICDRQDEVLGADVVVA